LLEWIKGVPFFCYLSAGISEPFYSLEPVIVALKVFQLQLCGVVGFKVHWQGLHTCSRLLGIRGAIHEGERILLRQSDAH